MLLSFSSSVSNKSSSSANKSGRSLAANSLTASYNPSWEESRFSCRSRNSARVSRSRRSVAMSLQERICFLLCFHPVANVVKPAHPLTSDSLFIPHFPRSFRHIQHPHLNILHRFEPPKWQNASRMVRPSAVSEDTNWFSRINVAFNRTHANLPRHSSEEAIISGTIKWVSVASASEDAHAKVCLCETCEVAHLNYMCNLVGKCGEVVGEGEHLFARDIALRVPARNIPDSIEELDAGVHTHKRVCELV